MLKKIQCQLANGEKYNRYIGNGVLENPEQTIDIVDATPIGTSGLVSAIPAENKDVRWTDEHGGTHAEHIFKGHPIAVNEKFIVDAV